MSADAGQGVTWHRWDAFQDYQRAYHAKASLWRAQNLWANTLHETLDPPGFYPGYCGVCEALTAFTYRPDSPPLNVRESLICECCQLNARQRAAFSAMRLLFPLSSRPAIYLTEQATPSYRAVKARWGGARGSEYFPRQGFDRLSSYVKHLVGSHEWLRWEDVCHLSFKDRSLDGVVCLEVLEHVPNYVKALEEFARVLRPGGHLIVTVPFLDQQYDTLIRAQLRADGRIEHLCEPEYHGDPVDGQGILAYYHFGWDLLDTLRGVGFAQAQWWLPWAPAMGLFSRLWTLVATR